MSKLAVCVTFVVALTAGSASGQALPSDPDAVSPAGTVYELPLDNARQDAAPRRPSRAGGKPAGNGSAGNGSSGSGSTSSGSNGAGSGADGGPGAIRSENGFGSSSNVPGASGGDAGSDDAASTGTGTGTGSADGKSGAKAGAALKASDDGPSSLGVYALLAFVLVAGVATGLITRSRRGRGSPPAS